MYNIALKISVESKGWTSVPFSCTATDLANAMAKIASALQITVQEISITSIVAIQEVLANEKR